MRLRGADGQPLSEVFVALTEDEASELASAVETLKDAQPGWHEHVSDASFQRTITILREDDPTAAF